MPRIEVADELLDEWIIACPAVTCRLKPRCMVERFEPQLGPPTQLPYVNQGELPVDNGAGGGLMTWVKKHGLLVAGFFAVGLILLGLLGVGRSLVPSNNDSNSITNNKSSKTQTVTVKIPDKQTVKVRIPGNEGKPASDQGDPDEVEIPDVEVEIPDAVFDRLGPVHDSGRAALAAPSVAAVAAGVSIVVALIALSGVWKTVEDKWNNDQLSALWDRFTWVVDTSRAKLLNHEERRKILEALENRARTLEDRDLEAVIKQWRDVSLDSKYDDVWKAAQNAITVLRTIRDDESRPLAVRKEAEESINTLQSLIPPSDFNDGQTAPSPTSVQPTPAGSQPIMLVSRETAGPIMDKVSAAELAATNDTVQTQSNKVDELIRQTLDSIADGIGRRVDEYARMIADQKLKVTNALGKNGVTRLRDDLNKAAVTVADELRESATQIDWRDEPSAIAVFKFLHGRVRRFDAILEGRGYQMEPHGELSPYSLFDRESLDGLERELVRLFAVENAVQLVKAVDARVRVDSLWSDDTDTG
jgi:hypothetical protein